MSRSPDPQLARDWKERLDRFERSELTIAEFCRTEGYSTASFYQWRRKLQAAYRPQTPAFIRIEHACTVGESHADLIAEIALPGGAIVKLPGDASRAQQRDLIEAIVLATTSDEVTS
ncbi:MAG: hypothetical protein KDB00_03280 [Planctomycetales bacterium]|nr:hypothetical protein [Planctomycetales bacterium]